MTKLAVIIMILIFTLLLECSITKHKCLLHHGFDYVKGACFCYRYIPKKLDYQGAVDSCASHNSYLAKVNRGLIQHTLEHILAQKHDGGVRIQGIRDSGKTWRYNNGKTLEYFNWNEHGHQPDLKPNEVTLLIKKSQAYRWHDDFMYRNLSSVCQIY
ncbi:unnamed protein product [Mytilus coruscus]|uniref:C-type lectin domain-containing protein n=1 Tax=Mytilus coruscus TaxID=42192 RepID=A0A6J8A889_MYTCO|nr:unnamed protein product [Mytilus coruscus]